MKNSTQLSRKYNALRKARGFKQTFTPEQRERQREYAREYRKLNPSKPKTEEEKEARRLWQISYRARGKKGLTLEQKLELRAAKRLAAKQELEEIKLAKRAERLAAKKEKDNARRKPTKAQLGLVAKPRGRKSILPKPTRTPQKHKHIMRPMQKIKEKAKVLPTIHHDLSQKVKLHIPELRMDVYINPGQDIEAVRAKYLNR